MPRKKTTTEPESVTIPVEGMSGAGVEIRDAILNMSGFENEASLAAAIPDSTATSAAEKPKRTRRTKAEMEAAKGGATPNPDMEDKRYRDAVTNMSAFGGAKTVRAAFQTTGKPLDAGEDKEVDDYFYVISKRYGLDASKSGLFLSLYAILLILRLIVTRLMNTTSTNLWSQFAGMFDNRREAEDEAEVTTGD